METVSEHAFRALFDSNDWVIRRLTDDYGRDLEVELFEEGHATGILFGVQLKAIDKRSRKGRISVSGIKASSLNYWRALDYPFLVAAYSVPADRLYGRWAHSYDWHHKSHSLFCDEKCTPEPKTVTFHYGVPQLLTPSAVSLLPGYLRFFRAARQGDLRHQSMPVHVEGEAVDGHALASVESQIRDLGESTGRIKVVGTGELAVRLSYSSSCIRAVLPGDLRSATLHLQPGIFAGPKGHRSLAADGLVTICLLFMKLKDENAAGELLAAAAADSCALFESDLPKVIVPTLLEAGRADVVAALAEENRRRRRPAAVR